MLFSTSDLWELRIALLLHDIGKVHPKHHSDEHAQRSKDMMQIGLNELKKNKNLSNSIEKIENYIEKHHSHEDIKTSDSTLKKGITITQIADITSSRYQKKNIEAFCGNQSSILRSLPNHSKFILIDEEQAKKYEKNLKKQINDFFVSVSKAPIDEIFRKFLQDMLIKKNNSSDEDIYNILSEIPSDTRFPINDHSLYSHMKATCLFGMLLLPFFDETKQHIEINFCLVRLNFKTKEKILKSIKINDSTGRANLHNRLFSNLISNLMKQSYLITTQSGSINFNLSWENIIYPDPIGILRESKKHNSITSAIDEILILLPGNKMDVEQLMINTLKTTLENVSEELTLNYEDLSYYLQPWININEEKLNIQFHSSNIYSSYIKNEISSKIRDSIEKMLKENSYDVSSPLIMNFALDKSNIQHENIKLCSSCGLFPGIVSEDRFDIVCSFCQRIRELGNGAWIDDIADPENDVARLTLQVQNLEKWQLGEIKSQYPSVGLKIPISCLERSHTLERTIEFDLRIQKTMNKCIELIEKEIENIEYKRIHLRFFTEGTNTEELPIFGNIKLKEETYGVFLSETNDNRILGKIIGILDKDLTDVIKELENIQSRPVKTKEREYFLKNCYEFKSIKDCQQFKIISQSNILLEALVPGNKALQIITKISQFFYEELGMKIHTSCLVFKKKQPLPQIGR